MPRKLSHYDRSGRAKMVDVSSKAPSRRQAAASAFVALKPAVLKALPKNPKGDPLEVARLAGIMAAKRTSELIPLCHPLPLHDVGLAIAPDPALPGFRVEVTARTVGKTGVEMEALTGVAVALLTVYDMAKAIDKSMVISDISLARKVGGSGGEYARLDGTPVAP